MNILLDNTMLIEMSILTFIIVAAICIWAYVDTKQEKRLLDAIESEHRSSSDKHHA